MLGPLLEALFPRRCAGCGAGPWPFCARCRDALVTIAAPWCLRCGAPTPATVPSCRDCPPPSVALARAPFGFDGPVRRAVHRLKFSGWRPIAGALGDAMAVAWSGAPFSPDAVAWVPLSRARLAARGYDQARALALAVAPRLGIPAVRLLDRVGDPGPQARRGGDARREAMRGMFAPARRPPARILLVDDVLTTGATAAACAEALLEGGAAEVALLTAARAVSSVREAAGRVPRPILASGLGSGSVVAPGRGSPAVDASRGRSDPRKPTLGR
ncbi:MAG TPA: double zinc ribbon domain-containing protein [Actinomycetota bacterium]|nr:double zinc ribbon domain-containing protein [Actinomycetota bacterium]